MSDSKKFNWLIMTASEQFEEHSKKIEGLLSRAQERFSKDHTGTCGGVGILMIIASFVMAIMNMNPVFYIASLSLGVGVLSLALVLRTRSAEKQIKYTHTLLDLERERARFAQKQAVLSHIWIHGLPEGTPLAQIQMLLGENPSKEVTETWKQLPKPTEPEIHENDDF